MNLNTMKVAELKDLLKTYGHNDEDVDKMKKAELIPAIAAAKESEDILDNAEEINDVEVEDGEEQNVEIPERYSLEWSDYVMSLFDDRELQNGMPRTDSLRRVAHFLFGKFSVSTHIAQIPDTTNNNRATVIVTINIDSLDEGFVTYSGAADCCKFNTETEYAKHPVATAETRAEGRALRKLLGLVKVFAAEEVPDGETAAESLGGGEEKVSGGMLNGIDLISSRLNIDVDKLIVVMDDIDVEDKKQLTETQAKQVILQLQAYQKKEQEIPEKILKKD